MKWILAGGMLFAFTGCAAMWSRAMMPEPPQCGFLFGGVKGDITEFMADISEPWVVAGGVVDLPFSFAADIVLSPYDLYQLYKANYVYCRPQDPLKPSSRE